MFLRRGGLDEFRLSACSEEAALVHYLHLSTGVFQDYEFVLHAYDMIARKKCLTRAGVQARMQFSGASRAEAFAGLTPDQLNIINRTVSKLRRLVGKIRALTIWTLVLNCFAVQFEHHHQQQSTQSTTLKMQE